MRRRDFISLIGGVAAAWPLAARAQGMRKLGVLMIVADNEPDSKRRIAAFQEGLRDLGWHDGQNIHIEYRWAAGRPDLIHQYAQELVALAPDVILANGTTVVAELKALTRSIPIVFALAIDPVSFGFVDSLSRPGGNITGFSFINAELIGKWTALLKVAAPSVNRAALLYNPKITPFYPNFLRELAATPQSAALEIVPATVETIDELQMTIEALGRTPGTGLIIGPDAFLIVHMDKVARLAAANRLPGISVYRQFVMEGGLISYGPDTTDIFRRSGGTSIASSRGQSPPSFQCSSPANSSASLGKRPRTRSASSCRQTSWRLPTR